MKLSKENVQELLLTNSKAVERAMVVIYDRQTQDEKATSDTRHTNQRGFSGAHAKTGSYYARWVLSGRSLTGKHLDKARAISLHYWRQLIEEAEFKGARRKMTSKDRAEEARRRESKSLPGGSLKPWPVIRSAEDAERYMHELEAHGDREQTIREDGRQAM